MTVVRPIDRPRAVTSASTGQTAAGSTEAMLRRFASDVRQHARQLMRTSPRAGDLATAFPGALHVMADPRTDPARRERGFLLADGGAPLKDVSDALGLALWMRRLPPEAFHGGVPAIEATESFARRIVNRLPTSRRASRFWLESIAFAHRAAGEDFAVWLADKIEPLGEGKPEQLFRVLAAYAWFSRSGAVAARDLIAVRWRPEMALETAICAAKSWLNRTRLVCQLPTGAVDDSWLAAGTVEGYTITPLLDAPSLLAESRAMNNCADQYADKISRDRCRLFSIRRGGTPVATVEIAGHPREPVMLTLTQLKTRNNLPAPPEIWRTAYRWLSEQPSLARAPVLLPPPRPLSRRIWQDLFEPYRAERHGAPWIPSSPTTAAVNSLEVDIAELARSANVTSWLFR